MKTPLCHKKRHAFTLVEITVCVLVFGLFLGLLNNVYSSVNRQGTKQDRETATWYIYTGAMELLRDDLAQATVVDVTDQKLEMKTVRFGNKLELLTSDVIWAQQGKRKLIRECDGKTTVFDFGTLLTAKDVLNIRFARIP
ncbi:MAG TPA: hypothetical protein PKM25_10970 [Candidatus Ozemobacteraceae bacterium]|nr:hypothetical protein [Candidatus Ozemobacteraceae bacterium]